VIFRRIITVLFLVVFSSYLSGLEFYDGIIKLNVNEKTGSFSMYSLSDQDTLNYQPLFNDREARASFIALNVDGKIYKLGKTKVFRTSVESVNGNPVVIYESPKLSIIETFTPVRTTGSQETNGIQITITIQNIANKPASVGLRMFLDTTLGEKNKDFHFVTNNQMISKETLFDAAAGELFWVSKNQDYSLMGNILPPADVLPDMSRLPDYVHFANWRRLYNARWTLAYKAGRSFNYRPYSLRDSAVCYYWEPAPLEEGNSFTYSVYLTTEDSSWYGLEQSNNEKDNANLLLMYQLQETLNKFINGEIYLEEYELDEIERTIDGLKMNY